MKNRLVILALLLVAGVASSVCQPPVKSAFSLSIDTADGEVASRHPIELQITKTNLSDHVLLVGGNRIAPYTFDVRRNGVLVPETEQAKNLREHPLPTVMLCGSVLMTSGPVIDGNLPPHAWALDTAAVNEFRDMRQPGIYTVQVRENRVKSNTVTVTVLP